MVTFGLSAALCRTVVLEMGVLANCGLGVTRSRYGGAPRVWRAPSL